MQASDFHRLVLALPQAVLGEDHGAEAFTVAGKIFCTLSADAPRATIKLDPEDQANLIAAHPGVVEAVAGYWGRKGWTYLWWETAGEALVADLLRLSWFGVAPAALRKAFGRS